MRIWTLLAIAFANLYMNVAEFGISVTFLVLFAGGFMLLSQLPNKIYHLFAALVIMIAYDSILMWEHEVPIWLIVPRPLFFTVCMLALLLVMIYEFRNRLAVIITGVCAAELFYAVMMFSYQIPYTAGSKYFLDGFATIIAGLVCWHVAQELASRIHLLYKKQFRMHDVVEYDKNSRKKAKQPS